MELYIHAPIFLHGVRRDNFALTFYHYYGKILKANLKISKTNCRDTPITEHSNISFDTSVSTGVTEVMFNPKSMVSALKTVVMLWQHQYKAATAQKDYEIAAQQH